MQLVLEVNTNMRVDPRLIFGGICRRVALAARCKSTMIFFTVRATINRTTWGDFAGCGGLVPFTALLTEGNACINKDRMYNTEEAFYKR